MAMTLQRQLAENNASILACYPLHLINSGLPNEVDDLIRKYAENFVSFFALFATQSETKPRNKPVTKEDLADPIEFLLGLGWEQDQPLWVSVLSVERWIGFTPYWYENLIISTYLIEGSEYENHILESIQHTIAVIDDEIRNQN